MPAPDHRLPKSLLFLYKTLAPILEQSLCWKRAHSGQTGQHDLRRQFRLFLLNTSLTVLKHAVFLFETLDQRNERLYLHLEFDTLPPQEFASLLQRISWSLSILVCTMIVLLVLLILLMWTL